MAAAFDLAAFFKGLCTSSELSSFFFYNCSVCSEVIRKIGAPVSLREPFLSCDSTVFARDTDFSEKPRRNPMSAPQGKFLPVLAATHSMCYTF